MVRRSKSRALESHLAPSLSRSRSGLDVISTDFVHLLERRAKEADSLAYQLKLIIEHAPCAVAMLDSNMKYLWVSNRWIVDFGLRNHSCIGKSHYEIFPDIPDRWREIHQRCLNGAIEKADEDRFDRADGSFYWLRWEIHPWRNESGVIGGILIFSEDITQKILAQEELRRAKEEAEKGNHAKDLFLATLSHELRTPLTAILAWAQMLRLGKLDEKKAKLGIQIIEESALNQGQLINDLLDISRIIMGKLAIEMERTNPAEVLQRVVESIRPAAEKKRICVVENVEYVSEHVWADPARLSQIFGNLLVNAIKFTPPGGQIEISFEMIEISVGNNLNRRAKIKIRDTGKGIRADFLPRLFDRFSQADSSSIRVHGGLGLGLALVRSLLDLQGGTVEAESPGEGKGATFTVFLPLILNQAESIQRNHQFFKDRELKNHVDYPNLSGIRVLLIEDEEKSREALNFALASFKAEMKLASSAEEGVCAFREFKPDVIISDIGLANEDGYSFIRRVRALEAPEITPAIALTAFAGPENRSKALHCGFQIHMAKPVDVRDLGKMILKLVSST